MRDSLGWVFPDDDAHDIVHMAKYDEVDHSLLGCVSVTVMESAVQWGGSTTSGTTPSYFVVAGFIIKCRRHSSPLAPGCRGTAPRHNCLVWGVPAREPGGRGNC